MTRKKPVIPKKKWMKFAKLSKEDTVEHSWALRFSIDSNRHEDNNSLKLGMICDGMHLSEPMKIHGEE